MKKIIYGLNQNPLGGIIADERYAKVVYSIFEMYLEGKSLGGISKELKARDILSPTGKETWSSPTIENILSNILYVGIIIPPAIFLKVEEQRNIRSNKQLNKNGEEVRKSTRYNSGNVLSGLLVCEECGSNYRRITKPNGEIIWRCSSRVEHGKKYCRYSTTITEKEVKSIICDILNLEAFEDVTVKNKIAQISIGANGRFTCKMSNTLQMNML